MPEIGFPKRVDSDSKPSSGWLAEDARFWIRQQDPKYASDPPFSKDRVGLCEICFSAPSRAAVDALAGALADHGFTILDAPKEYSPAYDAVFFADPDGIKLEYAHTLG
jgi:catechol 2,3-dioxygenase-like lactoylglutathione lyase family enzyme